jgi:thioredoxin-related protein
MKLKTTFLTLVVACSFSMGLIAQDNSMSTKKLYNPDADGKTDISNAIATAKKENKHVFLQIGGNWCGWCIAFDKKVNETDELKKILNDNYIVYHLNYSQENTNSEVLQDLGFPQRFGFPVFVILDSDGNRLHTQDSAYLEEGKEHSIKKVKGFLESWTVKALDPSNNNN